MVEGLSGEELGFYSEYKESHGNILGNWITRHSFCFEKIPLAAVCRMESKG